MFPKYLGWNRCRIIEHSTASAAEIISNAVLRDYCRCFVPKSNLGSPLYTITLSSLSFRRYDSV
jgi:hypothetical protein